MADDQEKSLELALAQLDRQFGKNTVIRLGNGTVDTWPCVSTGAFALDQALGIGGLPRGRIVEIFSAEGVGKTTLCLSVVAEAQQAGERCAFLDMEHAIDPLYAQALGVKLEDLYLAQPDYGEQALEILDKLVASGAFAVIVVDSIAALTPKAELEGEMGTSFMGLLPRLMAQAMRKLVGKVHNTNTLVIFTNQLREKLGIVYGSNITQPGGRAVKFAASVRIDLSKKEDIKDAKTGYVIGSRVKAKIVKNKMAPPLRITEFDILYGRGVDNMGCILDLAVERGIMQLGHGGRYKYGEESFAHGRPNAVETLASDLTFAEELKERIIASGIS